MNKLDYMLGMVFTNCEWVKDDNGDCLIFSNEKEVVCFTHVKDCCEDVYIESVVGDLNDLLNSPILLAEVSTKGNVDGFVPFQSDEILYQWTFYKFATKKGYVDVRWYGDNEGFYSVEVSDCHYKR